MQIGTIVSRRGDHGAVPRGTALGHVEEAFIARLRPGDCFVFAGRVLEFVRVHEMTAWVQARAARRAAIVPRWTGAKMALSTQLAERTRELIAEAKQGAYARPRSRPCGRCSSCSSAGRRCPTTREWLVERFKAREGQHLFLYPFAGRLAHIGLATLFAWRLSRETPRTFSMSVNDYGFELLSPEPVELDASATLGPLLAAPHVEHDILLGLERDRAGAAALPRDRARRRAWCSRAIPGQGQRRASCRRRARCSTRCSASTTPTTCCSQQAEREVLDRRLEAPRLAAALERMRRAARRVRRRRRARRRSRSR